MYLRYTHMTDLPVKRILSDGFRFFFHGKETVYNFSALGVTI